MRPPADPSRGASLLFALRLARREGRSAARRVGVYMVSITLGVAALVAIHSFRDDVSRSLEQRARFLMGADARLAGSRPLPDSLRAVVDSLSGAGGRASTVTTAVSMVLAPRSERVRLMQVRAVEGGWPFYGTVETSPAGRWDAVRTGAGTALVDEAVLTQLDVRVGDTLAVGGARLRIAAAVRDLPTDLGFQTAVGPRVWISASTLADAGILGFGSLARYETYLALPGEDDAGILWTRYADLYRATGFRLTTASEQARELTDALDFLARYLGLVGLGALLLGGVGVASAIHVYVEERLASVAVLRCLGARQWTVFHAYLIQAAALGSAGALAGVAVGALVQQLLPVLLGGWLPVEVDPRFSPATAAGGLAIGVGVAVLSALPPLLSVRDVPPLRALRRDVEPERAGLDPWRVGVYVLIAGCVAGLAIFEAPSAAEGLAFAGGLAVATGVLRLTAGGVVRATRRFVPARAPWVLRQGVSNLFRPRNQTVVVTLALGFGVFVVGTVLQVQGSLAKHLSLDASGGRPNVLMFDVQPDQVEGVLALLPPGAGATATVTPVVPARIAGIGGRAADELRADTAGPRPEGWALRREYRHTYRSTLAPTEDVVAGRWFDDAPPSDVARISVEEDLAHDLDVGVGDTVTWSVGGRTVPSVVTSLRRVDWEEFATNFFVVFEPGVLEEAPQMAVILVTVADDRERDLLQRELVERYPNVSVLDLDRVQEAVDAILGQVDRAARFLALFSALAGLLVMAGALAASRQQRVREGALLRTLGARRPQVIRVLLAEYVALAGVAALTGLSLAGAASWALVAGVFGIPWAPSAGAAAILWLGVTALTVVVGMAGSRSVLSRPPLPVLRETAE